MWNNNQFLPLQVLAFTKTFVSLPTHFYDQVLNDFSLTERAATLIFITVCGVRLFHLLKNRNKVLFIIW